MALKPLLHHYLNKKGLGPYFLIFFYLVYRLHVLGFLVFFSLYNFAWHPACIGLS